MICDYCKKPIPLTTIDGKPSRESADYKQVLGRPDIAWHYLHPEFPDCFHLAANDPTNPWYDDPRQYADEDTPEPFDFDPEDLDPITY